MRDQSLSAAMAVLEDVAREADAQREMLQNVQLFVDEINEGGKAVASAAVKDDVILLTVCLGASTEARPALPAPRPVTTEAREPSGEADPGFEAGAEPAAKDGLSIPTAAEEPEAQVGVPTPAPPVGGLAPVPNGSARPSLPRKLKEKARPKPAVTAPKPGGRKKRWDDARELKLARLKLAEVPWSDIADRMGATVKACKVRWQLIKNRADVRALDGVPEVPKRKTGTCKAWAALLNGIGNVAPWSVVLDAKLAGHMARNIGVGSAAALLKMDRDKVNQRWKALSETPFQFDIEGLRAALNERFVQGEGSAAARESSVKPAKE